VLTRSRPQLASIVLVTVILFALTGLAWGVLHDGSAPRNYGSATQQDAARAALLSNLPIGLRADPTFTACGSSGDACVTSASSVDDTVSELRTAFAADGGHLDRTCTPNPAIKPGVAQPVPLPECAIEGKLKGAWVDLGLGSGWWLPGKPQPRTAVLMVVETKPAAVGTTPVVTHATLPTAPPDITGLIPAGWTVSTAACDITCPVNTSSAVITATGTLTAKATEIAQAALAKGFRIEGKPCKQEHVLQGCEIQADRRENGTAGSLYTVMDVTLAAGAGGKVGGTFSLTDQS
jgi:hypothetical protein